MFEIHPIGDEVPDFFHAQLIVQCTRMVQQADNEWMGELHGRPANLQTRYSIRTSDGGTKGMHFVADVLDVWGDINRFTFVITGLTMAMVGRSYIESVNQAIIANANRATCS